MSTSSKYTLRDAALEPPGGEDALRARALLDGTEDLDETAGAWGLDRGQASEALRDAKALLRTLPPELWAQSRPPSVHECAHCGWYPARRVTLTRYAAVLFSIGSATYEQSFCRRCGLRRCCLVQTDCSIRGFLGFGTVATPFVMLRNARTRRRIRRLPEPLYRAPEVVTKRREPASTAIVVAMRTVRWVLALAVLVAALAGQFG